MTPESRQRPLRTGGHAWGQQRVRLGIPMNELARRSGVHKAKLSMAESGRYLPTADEWDRVMQALGDESRSEMDHPGPVSP